MNIPAEGEVIETAISKLWFENKNFVCSVSNGNEITKEALAVSFDYIQQKAGKNKICWLGDISRAGKAGWRAQDYGLTQASTRIKASALVRWMIKGRFLKSLHHLFAHNHLSTHQT